MIYVILLVFGLSLGSFVNALVWRVHESNSSGRHISVMHGRSMCTHCRHKLSWYDLVPIVSFILLRGKCRYCGKNIQDSPFSEIILPALYILSYIFWPYGFGLSGTVIFVLWLASLVVLLALFIYDLRWMILPDKLSASFAILSLAIALVTAHQEGITALVPAILAAFVVGGVFHVLFIVSNGRWIGGGDVKLGYSIGLLLGTPLLGLLCIFIASSLGVLVALPQIISRRFTVLSKVAFGPFLITATILVFLSADFMNEWLFENLLYVSI